MSITKLDEQIVVKGKHLFLKVSNKKFKRNDGTSPFNNI